MSLCVIGIHSTEWVGICKMYHCYGFYHLYEIYRCTKCGKIKKKKITSDSMRESDCSDVPTLLNLIGSLSKR